MPLVTPPRRIVVCEAGPLTPERDAGARAVVDLLDALRALGHNVTVVIESLGTAVETARAANPELIIISRPGLFLRLEPLMRPLAAPIVYWAHDLHFERLALHATLDPEVPDRLATVMRLVEEACFTRADLSVLPTADEAERAHQEFPGAAITSTPYFAMPEHALRTTPPDTERLVFVGGEAHAPNRDGVDWFLAHVWPRLRDHRPQAELVIAGAWSRPAPWPRGVTYAGAVPDAELDALLRTARVGIAPLRFGAGMKRKTLHYLSLGLPVVGTSYAVQGVERDDSGSVAGVSLVSAADTRDAVIGWLVAVDALLSDNEYWSRQSTEGAAMIHRTFSESAFRAGIDRVVSRVLGGL